MEQVYYKLLFIGILKIKCSEKGKVIFTKRGKDLKNDNYLQNGLKKRYLQSKIRIND